MPTESCPFCNKVFPIDVPEELLKDDDLGVVCPKCGRHFALTNGERLVWVQGPFGDWHTTFVPKYKKWQEGLGYYDTK